MEKFPKPTKFRRATRRYRESLAESSTAGKLAVSILLAASMLNVLIYGKDKLDGEPSTRTAELASKYQIAQYDKIAKIAFHNLVSMNPVVIQNTYGRLARYEFAKDLQLDITAVSHAAYKQDLDYAGLKVDGYSVAHELIPEPAQQALQEQNFEFMPLRPVSCDISYTQNPHDFTNHLKKDFEVKIKPSAIREKISIPLTAPQESWEDYPLNPSPYRDLFKDPLQSGCKIYPKY